MVNTEGRVLPQSAQVVNRSASVNITVDTLWPLVVNSGGALSDTGGGGLTYEYFCCSRSGLQEGNFRKTGVNILKNNLV